MPSFYCCCHQFIFRHCQRIPT